ncbi:DNA/RNA-binding protein KIN17 [Scaptodrosophila lebanonensis]|uniref:DNA/RNA-binding protein KIN17 n=1 Tax=Drosophila lebanonensis TaxID=7225 RepID=A0A6J2TTW8_DROLE|nr:DNA/RNA-binding protein KIN17 [Scaptodrosophila lebanonensis]
MGRAEVGTPKYLANKMKAKGLQKLRWYCQMCEKQCRDENGFKCHTMSESHQRQLLLFADSPGKFLHSFSKEFSDGYMELLRRRFGTKRTNANKIYQEYIAHKEHIHMNATRWLTLSDYVKWLGRTGQVIADETEKGWFVTYIDRSPEAMERQAKADRKAKMEKDDEEQMLKFLEKQIEKAKSTNGEDSQNLFTQLMRDEEKPIKLNIKLEKKLNIKPSLVESKRLKIESECRETQYQHQDSEIRTEYWLDVGIVVKFTSKEMGDKFYNQKAVVEEVIDRYRAKIKFLHLGDKLKVDQAHLETVIPALGKPVLVVNGAYRGTKAILRNLNERQYSVNIEVSEGPHKGRAIENLQYEDISKLYEH